jgi:hypothetical protein
MFAIISPEEYKTFLVNKVPSTIPDKMKDHINTLASIDGEAFFTMAITTAGEHMIEYIDRDDVLAHDVVCKIDYMDFTYESINDALAAHHHNLSGYWSELSWDDNFASVSYMIEDGGPDEIATVDRQGNVTAPTRLMKQMEEIG